MNILTHMTAGRPAKAGRREPPAATPEEPAEPTGPLRRCLATGEVRPKTALVRFVVAPAAEGEPAHVVPDIAGRLPGRGLWITADKDIVAAAVARRLFAKAARAAVRADTDLPDRVAGLIARRCVELLGLARRAGAAVAGYEQVREWVARGRAGLVVIAADASAEARRKMGQAAGGLALHSALSADELGSAFGRPQTVHVALARGGLAARLAAELDRLAGFRPPAAGGNS